MTEMNEILRKELTLWLELVAKKPKVVLGEKTSIRIGEEDEWHLDKKTHIGVLEYLRTHHDVDKDWTCEYTNRWAFDNINGKHVQLCFFSKKHNPEKFKEMNIIGQPYLILVTPVNEKKKVLLDDYKKWRSEAIQTGPLGTVVHSKEARGLLKNIVKGREKKRGETCFYWHRGAKEAMWANNEEMREQAKDWKKQMKGGDKLQFLETNCQTKLINGEEWYILVCGHETKDLGFDPLGFGFDDCQFVVSGYIYFFKHKESRDIIFKWLQ
jgi:hypothetical protein